MPPLHVAVLPSPESKLSWPQMHSKSQCLNHKTRISSSQSRLRSALRPVLVRKKKTSSSRSSTLSVDLPHRVLRLVLHPVLHQVLQGPLANQQASRSSVVVVVRRRQKPTAMPKLPLKARRLQRPHSAVRRPRSFLVPTANRLPNGKLNSFVKVSQQLLN